MQVSTTKHLQSQAKRDAQAAKEGATVQCPYTPGSYASHLWTDAYNKAVKHKHYFKNVAHLETIDVYRVLDLFGVTDPCLQHAAKKILVAGGRGAKNQMKDVQEAIDSLERFLEMQDENERLKW